MWALVHVVQIKAARSLKRLLTGRLSSPVSSYPVFPGNEANFLRAQVGAAAIAADSAAWHIRPTGCSPASACWSSVLHAQQLQC
jgi:radial spoke head protein 4A